MIADKRKESSIPAVPRVLNRKREHFNENPSAVVKDVDFSKFSIPKDKEYDVLLLVDKKCMNAYTGRHADLFNPELKSTNVALFTVEACKAKKKRTRPFPYTKIKALIREWKAKNKPKPETKPDPSKVSSEEVPQKSQEPFAEIFINQVEKYYYFPFHNRVLLQEEFDFFSPGTEVLSEYEKLTLQPKEFNRTYLTEVIKEIKNVLNKIPNRKSEALSLEMKATLTLLSKEDSPKEIRVTGPSQSGKMSLVKAAEKIMGIKKIVEKPVFLYLQEDKDWKNKLENKPENLFVVAKEDSVELKEFVEFEFNSVFILLSSSGEGFISLKEYSVEQLNLIIGSYIQKYTFFDEEAKIKLHSVFNTLNQAEAKLQLLFEFTESLISFVEDLFGPVREFNRITSQVLDFGTEIFSSDLKVDQTFLKLSKNCLQVARELRKSTLKTFIKMVQLANGDDSTEDSKVEKCVYLLEAKKKVQLAGTEEEKEISILD